MCKASCLKSPLLVTPLSFHCKSYHVQPVVWHFHLNPNSWQGSLYDRKWISVCSEAFWSDLNGKWHDSRSELCFCKGPVKLSQYGWGGGGALPFKFECTHGTGKMCTRVHVSQRKVGLYSEQPRCDLFSKQISPFYWSQNWSHPHLKWSLHLGHHFKRGTNI